MNENNTEIKITSMNLYDEVEEISNCTVQILHNTITDEYSIGWWRNTDED